MGSFATSLKNKESLITEWSVYVAVFLVAICTYVNALTGEFVHDDIPAVVRNRNVLGKSTILNVLADDFWGTPMQDLSSHKSYRPLTTLTFRLNYLMFGLSPYWYHMTNIVLHGAVCILVTRVSFAVACLRPGFAALSGLIFATHPIHTDAVTGIVGRADVLACIFYLLSFLAYHGQDITYVWSSVCLGALSMLAKETGVTIIILNLLYDFTCNWHSIKRSISESKLNENSRMFVQNATILLISIVVLLILRLAMLHGSLPKFSPQDNPAAFHPSFFVRLLTFAYLAALNSWLVLCPVTLSHDWQMGSVPVVATLSDTRNLTTILFIAGYLLLTYRVFLDSEQQKHTPAALSWMFLILPFLPASNLFFTVGFVIAERILYIPSIGWTLLVTYGAQITWTMVPGKRFLTVAGISIVIILGSCRTFLRNGDWKSRETLARAGIRSHPHNAKMHYNFANFLKDNSQTDMAILHYRIALALWPGYASALNNLGTLMMEDQAEKYFLSAIRAQPSHANAHYNLGQLYRKNNRMEESIRMLKKCISIDPAYAPAYMVLAKMASNSTTDVDYKVSEVADIADLQAEYKSSTNQGGDWLPALSTYFQGSGYVTSCTKALLFLRSRGHWSGFTRLVTRWHLLFGASRPGLLNENAHLRGYWSVTDRYIMVQVYDCSNTQATCVTISHVPDINKSRETVVPELRYTASSGLQE